MSYKVRETNKERDELRKESIFIQMGMNKDNPETQDLEGISHPLSAKHKPENWVI